MKPPKSIAEMQRILDAYNKDCLEVFDLGMGRWEPLKSNVYQIRPEADLRIIHKKLPLIPLSYQDWAGGPWWVRQKGLAEAFQILVVDACDVRVYVPSREHHITAETLLKNWERSTDLINWHPCGKEANDC